jgi:ABC-type dipeptide/oligopeptide/nickel transport system permease component
MRTEYILQRLLLLIPTLFGILLGVFLMLHLAPGDPVDMLVDFDRDVVSEEQLDLIREQLGLNRPLYIQFFDYVYGVLQGDLGTSYRTKLPVTEEIVPNVMPTLQLALAGISVAIVIGVPAGIIAAFRPNTILDYFTLTASMVGLSAPNFWLGILFIYVFAFQLSLFPMIGEGSGSPQVILHHLVLPALVIGLSGAALLARLTRSAMLDILGEDFIRTAYAKGLRERVVLFTHSLRNAAIPIVAAAGTMFAFQLTGSVVVETVFSRRGLGRLVVFSIYNRDFPMVQGLILLFGFTIAIVNLFSDILIGLLDPRVSYD